MLPELCLVIVDTGKVLKTAPWDDSAMKFYNHWTKKFLKYKRTSPELKDLILANTQDHPTIIVGWSNSDDMRRNGMQSAEIRNILHRFESYYKRYWYVDQ